MAKRRDSGKGNYKLSASQNVDVWIREGFKDTACTEKLTSLEGTTENQLPGRGVPRAGRRPHRMSHGGQVNIAPSLLACSQQHQPGSHPSLHPQVLEEIGGVSEPAWAAAHRTSRRAPPGTENCPLSVTKWKT